jgi:AcrR family transcriptional regulator
MSNKKPTIVRKPSLADPRVRRSVNALGRALVQLMHERQFDDITVQDILDRAGVGRATFYTHYRNKDDVLYSGYERLFTMFEEMLETSRSPRLFPVAEFIGHLGDAGVFLETVRVAGKLDDFYGLGVDSIARIIERRIIAAGDARPALPSSLVSRMLAGALTEMVKWWLEHPGRSTPSQMDVTFHTMARMTLDRASYAMIRASA